MKERDRPVPYGDKVPGDFLDRPEPIIKPKVKRGLPCPDPVAVPPLRNPAPSSGDVWKLRGWRAQGFLWQVARHFIIGGVGTGLTVLTTTRDLSLAGVGFIAGGVAAAVRKGVDDTRRADGKSDVLTTIRNVVTREKGDSMGIRTEVQEFQSKLAALVMIFFDETPDKEQVMEVAEGAWAAFNEAKDLKDISKDDMVKAGIDTALTMAASLKDQFIKYSDEVEVVG